MMISFPVIIYQHKEKRSILLQPAMGTAVIMDNEGIHAIGSGIIDLDWIDKEEKRKWKKLMVIKK